MVFVIEILQIAQLESSDVFPLDWRDVPRADYLCFHRRQQKERLCVSAKGKLGHEKRRPLFLLCEGEFTAWRPFYFRVKGAARCFGGLAIRFINDCDKLSMCNSRKSARFAPLQRLWFGHNSVNIHRHRMWRGNKWLHAYKLSSQMTTTSASLSLFSRLRILRNSEARKRSVV